MNQTQKDHKKRVARRQARQLSMSNPTDNKFTQTFALDGDVCVITTVQRLPAKDVRDQMIKNRDNLKQQIDSRKTQDDALVEIEANIAKISGLAEVKA